MWTALCLTPPGSTAPAPPPTEEAVHTLATWALQFTPRVAVVESAVVMELSHSLRLFGGQRALEERIQEEAPLLGVQGLAWSSNSLAALALARGVPVRPPATASVSERPLSEQLDALPLHTLSATQPHQALLARLGCSTLGHLRALPRSGLRRRVDKTLVLALDQVYGLQPETHTWQTLPDTFQARLELMARVEMAPALLFGAHRLLLALCAWLSARHEGVTTYRLRWAHDSFRSRDAGPGGELVLRTAAPTRQIEHLSRLLAEHLAHVRLAAPVDHLELSALEVEPLADSSVSLWPEPGRPGESLGLVMERLAARLGSERVLRPEPQADHRLEWMTHWHAVTEQPTRLPAQTWGADLPQPCFVLPEPLKLPMQGPHPVYHGALRFLTGPHRVEGGWWDRVSSATGEEDNRHVSRDYWVALSEQAGVLWVFQERRPAAPAWYLHGIFA